MTREPVLSQPRTGIRICGKYGDGGNNCSLQEVSFPSLSRCVALSVMRLCVYNDVGHMLGLRDHVLSSDMTDVAVT